MKRNPESITRYQYLELVCGREHLGHLQVRTSLNTTFIIVASPAAVLSSGDLYTLRFLWLVTRLRATYSWPWLKNSWVPKNTPTWRIDWPEGKWQLYYPQLIANFIFLPRLHTLALVRCDCKAQSDWKLFPFHFKWKCSVLWMEGNPGDHDVIPWN